MKLKVGVIQEAPVFFDKGATLARVEDLVREQAAAGCKLLLFPESFVPGYPRGMDFGAVVGSRNEAGRELFRLYHAASFSCTGPEVGRIENLARETDTYIVLGVTEREGESLYCSMLYFSPVAGLVGKHRKMKPTGSERLVWGEGQADSLITVNTGIGKLGGLICWENYMPFARMGLYRQGVQLYLAPTADARESWISTLRHIALEGRCFVLGSNQYFTHGMYPPQFQEYLSDAERCESAGGSVIISPLGELLQGPLWKEPGVLVEEIDLDDITRAKMDFDVCGHYSRPDQFNFEIPNQPAPINDTDHEGDQPQQ